MLGVTWSRLVPTLLLIFIGLTCPAAWGQIQFDVQPQSLANAVKTVAAQANLNIIYDPLLLEGLISPPIKAQLKPDDALALLLSGTHLRVVHIDAKTVRIITDTKAKQTDEIGSPSNVGLTNMRLAYSDPTNVQRASGDGRLSSDDETSDEASGDSPADRSGGAMQEVVVTGTHIRGVTSTSSPVQVYSRNDIDQSGAGNVAEFVRDLPSNFAEASETTGAAVQGGRGTTLLNVVGGSGVDLRGLGTESTLVLVNGRRLAPGNSLGNFVDISLIPLSAVDRVEVVKDGASAIYGSDAVGGVINFILRRDFQGSETRARYGSVTQGSRSEKQVGETVGQKWSTGSALLSYEYLDQTPLLARDRSFSNTSVEPFSLTPQQTRHGIFGTVEQAIADGTRVFLDGAYGYRSTYSDFALIDTYSQQYAAKVRTYTTSAGAQTQFANHMDLEFVAMHGENDSHAKTFESIPPGQPSTQTNDVDGKSTVTSLDAQLSGPLVNMPTGQLLFAVGAQFRRETFNSRDFLNDITFEPRRTVIAEFVEARVPLLRSLALDLADRNEHYSDFGSTNNPKVGLSWRTDRVTLRATFGTSFRAPGLSDTNPTPSQAFLVPLPDPLKAGSCDPTAPSPSCTNALYVGGGNPDLMPEKAKTWTVGFDLHPADLPGIKASLSYYNIRYRDRIIDPGAAIGGLLSFLQEESLLGSAIVRRNPSAQSIQQLITAAGSNYVNIFGVDPATVTAIVDGRLHNLAVVRTSGVDFALSYAKVISPFALDIGIDGTRILKFQNQFTSEAPTDDILNTAYNPVSLRFRVHGVIKIWDLSVAAFLNYTGSYSNNLLSPSMDVSSWTTTDLTATYQFKNDVGFLRNLSLTLGALNVANKNPPFLANQSFPIYFDGANANPLGRLLYAQLATKF